MKRFANPKVGCVAGEKRVKATKKDGAAGSGEGLYWKYESCLKRWDAELYSAVGAAGELFAIRTKLYEMMAQANCLVYQLSFSLMSLPFHSYSIWDLPKENESLTLLKTSHCLL